MMLSEDRQSHWAHLIRDGVYADDLVDFNDDDQALRLTKVALTKFVKDEEELDHHARNRVTSLKRGVIEGSPEWDILYRKYYEEERGRRGQS